MDLIIASFIAAAPTIAAILGIVSAVIKMKKNNKDSAGQLLTEFQNVKEEVMKTKEYETLKAELAIAHQENRELKKLIKELLTTMDKVERPKEE